MRKSRLSSTARCAADLIGVNRKTATYYFHRLREIITIELDRQVDKTFGGKIEVDESYFGGHRKGKRGRGAVGKAPVFSLLKCGDKIYTKIIPNARPVTLKLPLFKIR